MGQALYRKYRSRTLDEIVGQKPITIALTNALKNNLVSHAYLFTGPRGVGKTSVARIMAHQINGLEYTSDEMPMDIIEIDAASNRRIDEIRDLREKVRIAPVSAKYKVYIIDEVHMLTREAFNALLKTLEEPPEHVVFILATTEAHKLPETIISRTQRYNFKLANSNEVVKLLAGIAQKENIKIDQESLSLIAKHSGGSLRDAISLLDQVRHGSDSITGKLVRENLGLPSGELINSLLIAITTKTSKDIIHLLQRAVDEGASATLIAQQLIQRQREDLTTANPQLPLHISLKLINSLLAVEVSNQPEIQLELALLDVQRDGDDNPGTKTVNTPLELSTPITNPADHPQPPNNLAVTESDESSRPKAVETERLWIEILAQIKKQHNTLYGIIRMAQPDLSQIDKQLLTLQFRFPFHQKRINEAQNKKIVTDILEGLGINKCKIECILEAKDKVKPLKKDITIMSNNAVAEPANNPIDQIRNVFGGGEVLE